MVECIKAMHRKEERYSRLILEYCDNNAKDTILQVVDDISKEMNFEPDELVVSNSSANHQMLGEIYIEFDDDYDKNSGEFHERILKHLKLTLCD